MGVIKFVPGEKKIIDHRGNSSGHYEAVCDVCGTLFYPRRSNAKYCHAKCGFTAWRKSMSEGGDVKKGVTKRKKSAPKASKPKKEARNPKYEYTTLKELMEAEEVLKLAGEKVPKELAEEIRFRCG